MSKLCIILTGQMRTYECSRIINSYHRFLSSYDVDIYIFTWKNKGYSNNHGNPDLHISQDDILDEETIRQHYSQFKFMTIQKIVVEDFSTFQDSLSENMKQLYNTPFRFHSNVTTSIPIEYKYQQAIQWLSTKDTPYSMVMMTRPDMEILMDIPSPPMENMIYYIHTCDRCMDHCWFGKPQTIIKQLNTIYSDYESNQDNITRNDSNNRDNNELLLYQCNKNKINVRVLNALFVNLCYFRSC